VLELQIHGLWVEEKLGPDGTVYQKVSVPGLGSHSEIGVPDLPLARFDLAFPTTAASARLEVAKGDVKTLRDYLIWPQPVPELDHEEGEPERFERNAEIYALDRAWPFDDGEPEVKTTTMLRSIPAAQVEVWPVRWNPATRDLEVASSVRYTFHHGGEKRSFEAITKERAKLAEKAFANWAIVAKHFPHDLVLYTGDFLIIYPTNAYQDELLPFVQRKASLGFVVTQRTVAEIGSSCNAIRGAIMAWEAQVPANHDAYVLLVGDEQTIPLCTAPTGVPTDDLYASTNGNDLDEEVFLGRLSVDGEADTAAQIAKILAYETGSALGCGYDRAVLWAHKENAPGKYEGAHETVRNFPYSSVTPDFITRYGSQAGVTDASVVSRVDDGVGVLAYRGHGSSAATATNWNQTGEYFDSADVAALASPLGCPPVVWSFACSNLVLSVEDAIGEIWLERPASGTHAYYGATVDSYTLQNHVLDEWMFRAVYDEDLVTQSHAIQRAEAQMAAIEGSSNAWMYLLLGDPDMQIRREDLTIVLEGLEDIYECTPLCRVRLRIVDELVRPLAGALVGLWKPVLATAAGEGGGEVFINRYADEEGFVEFEIEPRSSGQLYYGVQGGRGSGAFGSVEVRTGAVR
jgi:hypothetical protein